MTFDVTTALDLSLCARLAVSAVAPGGQARDSPVINVRKNARASDNTAAPIALRVHRRALNRTILDWPNMAQRLVQVCLYENIAKMAGWSFDVHQQQRCSWKVPRYVSRSTMTVGARIVKTNSVPHATNAIDIGPSLVGAANELAVLSS